MAQYVDTFSVLIAEIVPIWSRLKYNDIQFSNDNITADITPAQKFVRNI